MYYILTLLPVLAAMIWALRNEYSRKYIVGSVSLTLVSVFVLIRYSIVGLTFEYAELPSCLYLIECITSLYILPLTYAYLCNQCGTQWKNKAFVFMVILPLVMVFNNSIIDLGNGIKGLSAHDDFRTDSLNFYMDGRKLLHVMLRPTIIIVQCLTIALRMGVLWFRIKKYGLKFTNRVIIYYGWMFLLLAFTIYAFATRMQYSQDGHIQWIFFLAYDALLVLGFLCIPYSFSVSPVVTADKGEAVEVDAYIDKFTRRNQHLIERLHHLFEKEKIFLQPGICIDDVTRLMGTNRTYVTRLMRQEFDASFTDYVNRERISYAKNLLLTTENTLEEVASNSGFANVSALCRVFSRLTGSSPIKWKKDNSSEKGE